VTDAADLCLLVLVADCVPVVVADERARAVGVAHAGWRGAVAGIAERLVAAVCATSGGRPGELWAGIGPSIGPAHYEVGPAVAAAVRAAEPDTWPDLLVPSAAGRVRLDLWQLNALQLRRAGVPADRIEVAGCSTFDADQPYFSHRRDGHPTGRFAAGVMLH
jgi:YfiH family protein